MTFSRWLFRGNFSRWLFRGNFSRWLLGDFFGGNFSRWLFQGDFFKVTFRVTSSRTLLGGFLGWLFQGDFLGWFFQSHFRATFSRWLYGDFSVSFLISRHFWVTVKKNNNPLLRHSNAGIFWSILRTVDFSNKKKVGAHGVKRFISCENTIELKEISLLKLSVAHSFLLCQIF